MGAINHYPLVIVCHQDEAIKELERVLVGQGLRYDHAKLPINGWTMFIVYSSGSKEGWSAQAEHTRKLRNLIKWLREDNSLQYTWEVMRFGEDDSIVGCSNVMPPKRKPRLSEDINGELMTPEEMGGYGNY